MHGDTQAHRRPPTRRSARRCATRLAEVALAPGPCRAPATATGMRAGSEGAKQAKGMGHGRGPAAVERVFADSGCAQMIHGHTHRPGATCTRGGRERVRWVLPDWYERAATSKLRPTASARSPSPGRRRPPRGAGGHLLPRHTLGERSPGGGNPRVAGVVADVGCTSTSARGLRRDLPRASRPAPSRRRGLGRPRGGDTSTR
jgi:hypothetical protein